jgi:hypothetical protein
LIFLLKIPRSISELKKQTEGWSFETVFRSIFHGQGNAAAGLSASAKGTVVG